MKRAVLVGMVLAALGVGEAHAHVPPEFAASVDMAEGAFPRPACSGVAVEFRPQHRENPYWVGAVAWTQTPCAIEASERIHSYAPSIICSIIVHEYGHLAGYDHSDDPASIMYGKQLVTHQPCRSLDPVTARHKAKKKKLRKRPRKRRLVVSP